MIEEEQQGKIVPINIEEEMKTAYIDYSMSVIVARALPDVRDGLKPVHRRILFDMKEQGFVSTSPHHKSAAIVGDVLGKYHPHGDSSVYFAMVRLAQDFAMRYTLVDGHGNFGSIDGDSPAAYRYTEARLTKMGEDMMRDLEKNTVDFVPNFANERKEPTVLPTAFPNLLVNGASGIAVGMATNMATHNLGECVNAIDAYIDNNDITIEELMHYIKAPDFPTGGIIYGYAGVKEAFETGRGRIVIRSKTTIETTATGHEKIIVTEIPYGVNKRELIEHIAELVNDKKIEGISNINDETDMHKGMRIVIDVKRDANSNVVLNKLFKMTALQYSFCVNNIALVNGRPRLLNLKDLVRYFVEHRHEVVTRRTQFDLEEAQKKAHILQGLITAVDNIDEVVKIIRASKTPQDAQRALEARFDLDELQSKAIVDMRLSQLTGLQIDKLKADYADLMKLIDDLNDILAHVERRMQIIKDELAEIKEKYGDERKTEIKYVGEEMNPEDFYADDEMVITISHLGYIKRTLLSDFRTQGRGGVGSKGSDSRDEDFIEYIYQASMHNTMLFFTQKGRCYWLKVYDIPEGAKNSKGRAIQNLLNIEADDKVNAFITTKQLNDTEFVQSHYLVFATKQGVIKKTLLEAYSRPRQNGVNAIIIRDDDQLVNVCLTDGQSEVLMANRNGRAIRFKEDQVRVMGRVSTGVRGMQLDGGDDEIVGMICGSKESNDTVMVISEKGYGKRTNIVEKDEEGNIILENGEPIDIYRVTHRGGKGVKTMNVTEKTGKLVAIMGVNDDNDLMIINKSGITIRLKVADIRVMGRATQGVRLINLEKRNDEIASVCKVPAEKEEDLIEGGAEPTEGEWSEENNVTTNEE